MSPRVTVPSLAAMKTAGAKITAMVVWDYQMARIVDRADVDMLVVGDSVGVNLWGHANPFEVTLEQMLVVAQAVRRGTARALVCCDVPFGPVQEGNAVPAAVRLVKEAGVDLVKLDGASDYPDAVRDVDRAGIPVFAQFGITPQRALRYGLDYAAMAGPDAQVPEQMTDELVREAKTLEQAGAAMLDFTNSGPVAGAEVARAVTIPVLGGFGGGPWLDGRVRMVNAAIGYAASNVDDPADTYANVARTAFEAITAFAADVRSARQIRGGVPVPRTQD
ncbi:3-methyl-2-oxobutanoate hydroxymethyltransferase [uncultured Jatrophihabitans sp.]|uniref:3-methyl-2-oxobutanoate hydroxymethyltransferase n=1 Tax=uncultured Jatrophihabitans sp. TaxID=1610747 RepID=UPI0035CC77E2